MSITEFVPGVVTSASRLGAPLRAKLRYRASSVPVSDHLQDRGYGNIRAVSPGLVALVRIDAISDFDCDETPVFAADTHPELYELSLKALEDYQAGLGERLP
jgi:hypothetical protein